MRGRGGVFARLSNGRGFLMKVWFLYHAHIDNRVCRCPNLFGEDGHHAESLRELARGWRGFIGILCCQKEQKAFLNRERWLNEVGGFKGGSGNMEVCKCGRVK